MPEHRYLWLAGDEVLARLRDGTPRTQVWHPGGPWTDFAFNYNQEGREVDVAEARQRLQAAQSEAGGTGGPDPFAPGAPEA